MAHKNWQQVKDTFHEALRRDTGERDSFLDEVCKGDIDFRIEVESLLISLAEAKSFLEQPVIGEVPQPQSAWRLEKGQMFSHYRIVSPIGSGGMGVVYLAEDEHLHRSVALKVLPEDLLENRERLQRFQREALVVSALNHPNILTIFEFGTAGDVHFLASEFVKGETLRSRLENGRLTLHDTLEIATQIASALKGAHEAGVVHRDIKPENVMIRDDGYVKVLDFGLAKLAAGPTADFETETKRILSKPGVIMGTVTYMSPEQARGRSIDARSDLFSFGVVLFEMLTGKVPFTGETMTDVVAGIVQMTPRPVSSYNSSVPDEMDRIIAKCLEKDRDERYQTAADLLADLKRLAKRSDTISEPGAKRSIPDGHPTQILVERATERSVITTQPSRKPNFVFAATGVFFIAALAVGYWYFGSQNTNQIASIAVLPFHNKSGDEDTEYLSDGLAESLIYRLSQLPNLKVSPTSSVFRYKGKEIEAEKVGKELGVDAVMSGRMVQRGDNLTVSVNLVDVRNNKVIWGEQYERKMSDLLATQREIARQIVDALKIKVSGDEKGLAKNYTENSEAYQLYLRGRFYWSKRNPEALKKAIEYFDQAIEKDPGFALAFAGLADAYVVPATGLPPREAMPKAKEAALKALELDESLAEAHTSLGRVLQVYDWNWAGAEEQFKRAIELNPRYAVAHQWYGGYYERLGRNTEAAFERKVALDLDPLSLIINFELGSSYYYGREYDKAIEQFKKTLELDPTFPAALQFLPAAYLQKGMNDEAIALFKKNFDSGSAFFSIGGLGNAYAVSGRKQEAHAMIDELKRLRGQRYISAVNVALVYAGLGDKDQAFEWLEKGYEERAFQMQWLKVEPRWDSLRDDPRFQDLTRRIGLQ